MVNVSNLLTDLCAVSLAGGLLGLVAKRLRLPIIFGYILAGFFIGPNSPVSLFRFTDQARVAGMAEIGIVLLMFSLGLEMGFRKLRSLGLAPALIGICECLGVWLVGTQVARYLGYSTPVAKFIGGMLAISSTTIIVSVLQEKRLMSARFVDSLVGILLVEDLIAILMLVYLPSLTTGDSGGSLIPIAVSLCVSLLIWWFIGSIVVPRIVYAAQKFGGDELLLIVSLGLCLGLAVLAVSLHFSAALGAFIMGAILADSRQIRRIETLVKPIRQMFGVLFFVSFGMMFAPGALEHHWKTLFGLLVALVIGKTLLTTLFSLLFGRELRDSLRIAGSMAQIGEFSFVIAEIGIARNFLPTEIFPVVVGLSMTTALLTPWLMEKSASLGDILERRLPVRFQRIHDRYVAATQALSQQTFALTNPRISGSVRSLREKVRNSYRALTHASTTSTLGRLAPWDEYLSEIYIQSGAFVEGKSLIELSPRANYHVNVVAIERDFHTYISPDPALRLLPGDELLIYGLEDDIGSFAALCSADPNSTFEGNLLSLQDCELASLKIEDTHPFSNRAISELRLRERLQCTILAVVRAGEKIKNPPSHFNLRTGDELFIVGPRQHLSEMHSGKLM